MQENPSSAAPPSRVPQHHTSYSAPWDSEHPAVDVKPGSNDPYIPLRPQRGPVDIPATPRPLPDLGFVHDHPTTYHRVPGVSLSPPPKEIAVNDNPEHAVCGPICGCSPPCPDHLLSSSRSAATTHVHLSILGFRTHRGLHDPPKSPPRHLVPMRVLGFMFKREVTHLHIPRNHRVGQGIAFNDLGFRVFRTHRPSRGILKGSGWTGHGWTFGRGHIHPVAYSTQSFLTSPPNPTVGFRTSLPLRKVTPRALQT